MQYEEWLDIIEQLNKSTTNIELLTKIKNTNINPNINDMIYPKLENMIKNRFKYSIDKIIDNLGEIFDDVNFLDLALINFKKEITYTNELIKLKQIPNNIQNALANSLKEETNKVYDILVKEANQIDYTGALAITINNNKIKWSE